MKGPFQNKMLFFPEKILKEIDKLISQGYSQATIRKYLEARHKKDLEEIPGVGCIERYVRWRKKALFNKPLTGVQPGLCNSILDGVEPIDKEGKDRIIVRNGKEVDVEGNKGEILQSLLEKCVERLNSLSSLDTTHLSPFNTGRGSLDDTIQSYIKEIRSLIETIIKLGGKLERDETVVSREEMDSIMQELLVKFRRTVERVAPDKVKEFAKVLEEEMSS